MHVDPAERRAYYRQWKQKNRDKVRGYEQKTRMQPGQKEKRRKYMLVHQYGLTFEAFQSLLQIQKGHCAICQTALALFEDANHKQAWVDHCHETGKIRGLLCSKCNTALGQFNDDSNLIRSALNYLEQR